MADKTAPTVSIQSPTAGSTLTGDVTLQAKASDNVGVASVTFYVGTVNLGNATLSTSGTWNLVMSSSKYPNGTYSLVAKAKDAAGNLGTSAAVQVIDKN